MDVSLAPELEQFIQAAVESGRYSSTSDALSAAVRLLQQHDAEGAGGDNQHLHARADDALMALTRGEGAEGEAYVENAEGRLEESQEDERPVQR